MCVASTVYERVCVPREVCVWDKQTVGMDSVGYKRRLVWGVSCVYLSWVMSVIVVLLRVRVRGVCGVCLQSVCSAGWKAGMLCLLCMPVGGRGACLWALSGCCHPETPGLAREA